MRPSRRDRRLRRLSVSSRHVRNVDLCVGLERAQSESDEVLSQHLVPQTRGALEPEAASEHAEDFVQGIE